MKNVIVKSALAAAALMLGTVACKEQAPDRTAELTECRADLKESSDELKAMRTQMDGEIEKRRQLELQLALMQSDMKRHEEDQARTAARNRASTATPAPTPVKETPKAEEEKKEEVKKEPDRPATPEPGSTRLRRK